MVSRLLPEFAELNWIHSPLYPWNVLCATGCITTPNNDQSNPVLNSWTDILFMKFSALCSPNIPCSFQPKSSVNLTGLVSKMHQACLNVLFCGSLHDSEFVQVSLNSWSVYHNSSVCGIFLEVFCSQTEALSSTLWYLSWSSRPCFDLHCSC